MPWVNITPGVAVTMKFMETRPVVRYLHWVDRRSVACEGEGCSFCASGSVRKERYGIEVWINGAQATWEFSPTVYTQLVTILGANVSWTDVEVKVTRIGVGLDTKYVVEHLGEAGSQPASTPAAAPVGTPSIEEAVHAAMLSEEYITAVAGAVSELLLAKLLEWQVVVIPEGE